LVGCNLGGSVLGSHADITTSHTAISLTAISNGTGAISVMAGGLVGYNTCNSSGSANITDSYATGNVGAEVFGGASSYAGGLVGYDEYTSQNVKITRAYAKGNVEADSENGDAVAGGLIGKTGFMLIPDKGDITDTYATGNIVATSANGNAYAGGLIGHYTATSGAHQNDILNAYATGKVEATGSTSAFAGGLIGHNLLSSSGNCYVYNTYATGAVTGGVGGTGGLVGYHDSIYKNYANNYWIQNGATVGIGNDTDPGVIEESAGATAFFGESHAHAVYNDTGTSVWDFAGTWDAFDHTYPRLGHENFTANFWVGSSSDVWSDDANWSGGAAPIAGENVMFTLSAQNDVSIVDAGFQVADPAQIKGFFIDGYEGTIVLLKDLEASGYYSQNAGTFNETVAFNGSTDPYEIEVAGQFSQAGGEFRDYSAGTAALRISNPTELNSIQAGGAAKLGKDYVQTAEINLSGIPNFDPIGDGTTQFTGSYHGLNNIVRNLKINTATEEYVGLFGYTDDAVLRNIRLVNVDVDAPAATGSDKVLVVGGLVGYALDTEIAYSYAAGRVGGIKGDGVANLGGLVGYYKLNTGTTRSITRCYSAGTINPNGGNGTLRAGGLVGFIEVYSDSASSVTEGNVIESFSRSDYVVRGTYTHTGGLVGAINSQSNGEATVNIQDCYARGDVIYPPGVITSNFYNGGLVGSIQKAASGGATADVNITHTYATGYARADTGRPIWWVGW